MAANLCIYTCRHVKGGLMKFKLSITKGEKGDLRDFERAIVVGATQAALSI